jgi:hypothetical protein
MLSFAFHMWLFVVHLAVVPTPRFQPETIAKLTHAAVTAGGVEINPIKIASTDGVELDGQHIKNTELAGEMASQTKSVTCPLRHCCIAAVLQTHLKPQLSANRHNCPRCHSASNALAVTSVSQPITQLPLLPRPLHPLLFLSASR